MKPTAINELPSKYLQPLLQIKVINNGLQNEKLEKIAMKINGLKNYQKFV